MEHISSAHELISVVVIAIKFRVMASVALGTAGVGRTTILVVPSLSPHRVRCRKRIRYSSV